MMRCSHIKVQLGGPSISSTTLQSFLIIQEMSTSQKSTKPKASHSTLLTFIDTTSPELAGSITSGASATEYFKGNFQDIESLSTEHWRSAAAYAHARTSVVLFALQRVQDRLQVRLE
jgi:hypothetical protein